MKSLRDNAEDDMEINKQKDRSPWWALGGVAFGFLLPLIGMACMVVLCMASFFAMSGMSASAAEPESVVHLSGPLSGPAVAVIDINGTIVSGSSGSLGVSAYASSDDVIPLIRSAASNSDVKALLLRIDSPGGSVVASDLIYHALTGCGKPIVVLMGEMAASGGYYISMAADHIVANPNTLTGSIGVISEFPEASALMEKLGVTVSVITSGEVKDMGSLYRPMTEAEKRAWKQKIDEVYESFVQIVADGRGMSAGEVRELADGSVYTGREALALGLIDSLGYEEDAVAEAADLGRITGKPRVIRYTPPSLSLFSALFSGRIPQNLLTEDILGDLLAPKLEFRWTGQ
jgi:protease-4